MTPIPSHGPLEAQYQETRALLLAEIERKRASLQARPQRFEQEAAHLRSALALLDALWQLYRAGQ